MEQIDTKRKYKLKRFINQLKNVRGRHTELVTVYIPKDYNILKVIQQLAQEKDTASNIKDKRTRTNVQDSLERLIRHLRLYKETPLNGLAAFAGNISENESKVDIEVFSIEPPFPITTRLYRCDQTFVLDELEKQLESNSMHGLVVVDKREATIGLLKGSYIEKLHSLTSGVPGKYKTGGQCQKFGSMVQLENGEIIKIEDSHNPHIVKSFKFEDNRLIESPITNKWKVNKSQCYKIVTKNPRLEVESSKDHVFFVSSDEGIIEKSAGELREGDYLLTPERINIEGNEQKLDSKKYYNSFIINKYGQKLLKQKRLEKGLLQRALAKKAGLFQTTISYYEIGRQKADRKSLKKVCDLLGINFEDFIETYTKPSTFKGRSIRLPRILDNVFAQFLGYYLGDGCSEKDRITFFEQDKQVALDYKKRFDKYFEISSSYGFRENKNYHQIRFTRRSLVRLIKGEFPEFKKTLDSEMPKKILRSPNSVVASFLKGFFDAEGYTTKWGVGLATNNKTIIRQIQLILLRFGILSSYMEYDNKKNPYSNNPIYKIQISDTESLKYFVNEIGFTSKKKKFKLDKIMRIRKEENNFRQTIISANQLYSLFKKYGEGIRSFPVKNHFYQKGTRMRKSTFRKIINCVKNTELSRELEKICNTPLFPVKISKIEVKKEDTFMIDISVKNQNFIANGIIVHNSAARFSRLREQAAKEFYIRIADVINKEFLNKPELKGIIIGGPGPTKNEFFDGAFINNEVKKKVLGLKDVTYTDEFGLEELVEKSKDLLAEEVVTAEKEILHKFLSMLATDPKRTAYGLKDVEKALEYGAVDTLLILEGKIDDKKAEELEEKAANIGAETEIVTEETQEGKQFKNLGGIAAILRFPIH